MRERMRMRVSQIVEPDSVRDLGNIEEIARSIKEDGLLHPLVINQDNLLICGSRRLEAIKLLKWKEVPVFRVTTTGTSDILRKSIAENVHRKDLLPSEMVAYAKQLRPQIEAQRRRGRPRKGGKLPQFLEGKKTRDIVAMQLNTKERTLQHAEEIVDSADRELIEMMDRQGKVNAAYRMLKRRQDEERIKEEAPQRLRRRQFRTFVIDPPWDYEGLSLAGRAAPEYAVMSMDELGAIDVMKYTANSAHLYLWSTNNFLYEALKLGEAWGFDYKTILTWVKPSPFGMGAYFRNSTEHCLFFVKGKAATRAKDIPTHFEAPRGEHSEKPDVFYDIVKRASHPPYLEIFARKKRSGWTYLRGFK